MSEPVDVPDEFLPDETHCLSEGDWTCVECGKETDGHGHTDGRWVLCGACYMADSEEYERADGAVECPECRNMTDFRYTDDSGQVGFRGAHVCPACCEVFYARRGNRDE
jgi:hypothetical protein